MERIYQSKADLFAVLADPLAIRLLDMICDRDHELSTLMAAVGSSQAADAAGTLARLRHNGLVDLRRTGSEVVVSLHATSVANLLAAARRVLHESCEPDDAPRLVEA